MSAVEKVADKQIEKLDLMEFLVTCGALEPPGSLKLRELVRQIFGDEIDSTAHRSIEEIRQLLDRYMEPGEKLSDLVIQMREE
ncbi:MAG: hypothetical protein ACE5MB_04760 [Anaerolineae bacterium]